MPNKIKIDLVAELKTSLSQNDAYVLIDYSGLTHKSLEEIRRGVKKSGGSITVVKNNLLLIASKESGFPIDSNPLKGPTAVLFLNAKDPSPLKLILEKGKELDTLHFKWGMWDKNLIDDVKIAQLASLPSINELRAQLVGQLKSPQSRLVYVLKGNLQKLTSVLSEIKKQREAVN